MVSRRFQDKFVLVTGGNSGIGLAAAQAFAAEGARVAISGRDPKTLADAQKRIGAGALAIQADLSKVSEVERLIAEVGRATKRIDALFVNAGVGTFAPIEQSDEAMFDRQFATNVKGAYFTIQKALPLMAPGSSIVINASAVVNLGMPNASIYAATKAAVASLARTLTLELAPKGIRINVVNPGPIETPIFDRMGLPDEAKKEMAGQIVAQVPQKRFGAPEDIARAVLYLSSEEASYVHGTSLAVDGGMSAL